MNNLFRIVAIMSLFSFLGCGKVQPVSCEEFHQLTAKNDLAGVKSHLENGHDANCIINAGVTSVMTATVYNRPEIITLLLKHSAKINAQTEAGWTALLYAADHGSLKAAEVLIKNGANINSRLKGGENAFIQAVYKNNFEVAKLLVNSGIDLKAVTAIGLNGLIVAANSGNAELTALLLAQPDIDINFQNTYGETALMRAVIQGHPEVVKILLKKGAEKDIKDIFNNNALFYTKKFNRPDIAELLTNKM